MSTLTLVLFLVCMLLFVVCGGSGLGGLIRDLTWGRDWWGRVDMPCVYLDLALLVVGGIGGIGGWLILFA